MKRYLAIILAVLMLVSVFAGCGKKEENGGRETVVIGYSYNNNQSAMNTWWTKTEELIEAYNADESNPYFIEYYFHNADSDVETQISDVESLIVREPDVIMIKPVDSEGSVPAFEACMDAGIPVVNDGFTINTENLSSTFILMDHIVVGELQAKWYEAWLEANPDATLNICYMQSDVSNYDMVVRREGFVNYMNEHCADRINWLSEKAAGYDANEAADITEDWLQTFPEVNAIVSPFDETAVAASEVCATNGMNVMICGVDGIEGSVRAIDAGNMSHTVSISWETAAEYSFKLALDIATGQDYDEVVNASEYALKVIDSTNVADYMAQYE